jgi:hypothetical protein
VYIGGTFTGVGSSPRNHLAKINKTTGVVDASFDVNLDEPPQLFNGIFVDGSVLYVGGSFNSPTSRLFVTGTGPALTTIPTVGEWAMIVLTLSLFCVAVMYVRKPALVFTGSRQPTGNASMMLNKEDFVFNAKWFFPLSFVVTAVVWSSCVYFHETAVRDMIGTACTGIVGGYLLQLLAVWYFDDAQ